MSKQDFIDDLMSQYRDLIKTTGCAVPNILASDSEPPYAYSIGFAQFGLPDIIITGNLPKGVAVQLINDLLIKWKKEGVALGLDNEVVKGFPVNLVSIPPSDKLYNDYVIHAVEFYRRYPEFYKADNDLPQFVQMVWPDDKGVMPDQESYNKDLTQPLLNGIGETRH